MTRSKSSRVRAIVLRGRQLGEADRVLTLLSDERGKIDAVAKGVRRARSHLAGRLEFMTEVDLELHAGRNLDIIIGAQIRAMHWKEIVEPEAFAVISLVAEMIDAFCEPDLPVPEVFTLLHGFLAALARTEHAAGLLPRFELRLLHLLGIGPSDEYCVHCGEAIGACPALFDIQGGGVTCTACADGIAGLRSLDAADVANLRALARDAADARGAAVHARPSVAAAVSAFVTHHLGRRPRAEAAIEMLGELGVKPENAGAPAKS